MCWPSTSASAISTILWYRSLARSNSSWMPVPNAVMIDWTSVFFSTRSMRAFSTLMILPRSGRIAWIHRVAAALRRAAGRIALHDIHFGLSRVRRAAVGQLAGQAPDVGGALAAHQLARLAGGDPCLGRRDRLVHNGFRVGRVGLEPVASCSLQIFCTNDLTSVLPSLVLVCPSNCGSDDLHRDDRRQALADVVAGEVRVLLLEQLLVLGVLVDHAGQRRAEALLVGAALMGVDGVGEGVYRLRIARVPLHRDLDLVAVALARRSRRCSVDRRLVRLMCLT